MFEKSESEVVELRFNVLDCMVDDAEDIEQIYLCINRIAFEKSPLVPGCSLRDIIDELSSLLADRLIEPKYSNDESCAPLENVNLTLLHHYWLSPTEKGLQWWKKQRDKPSNGTQLCE